MRIPSETPNRKENKAKNPALAYSNIKGLSRGRVSKEWKGSVGDIERKPESECGVTEVRIKYSSKEGKTECVE